MRVPIRLGFFRLQSALFSIPIRVPKYPHLNLQPVNIRSAPNPSRKYGIEYGKGKSGPITSGPITPLKNMDKDRMNETNQKSHPKKPASDDR